MYSTIAMQIYILGFLARATCIELSNWLIII